MHLSLNSNNFLKLIFCLSYFLFLFSFIAFTTACGGVSKNTVVGDSPPETVQTNSTDDSDSDPNDVSALAEAGAPLYSAQCADCHGEQGEGGVASSLDQHTLSYETLSAAIASTMPIANPGSCTGSCAESIASFIYESFLNLETPNSVHQDSDTGEPTNNDSSNQDNSSNTSDGDTSDSDSNAGDNSEGNVGDNAEGNEGNNSDNNDAGNNTGNDDNNDENGSSEQASEFFNQNVETSTVQNTCVRCHANNGIARNTDLIFVVGNDQSEHNEQVFDSYLNSFYNAYDYILTKVRGGAAHGGGIQLTCDESAFKALEDYLQLKVGSSSPADIVCDGSFWDNIALANAEQTLRRAALILAGRLPEDQELQLANQGDSELRTALRNLMAGDQFHEFLVRGANDRLLTKAFAGDGDLKFGNRHDVLYPFFSNSSYEANVASANGDPDAAGEFNDLMNGFRFASAMAPLKLVAHVVENDLPYTEILTADYTMVNPDSNFVFNSGVEFENNDRLNFKPGLNQGQILENSDTVVLREEKSLGPQVVSHGGFIEYPHAGLLNDLALLNRYPSTDTNRNRGRANWVFKQFLNIDIEKSTARTTDPEDLADLDNPTLKNPACTVCHNVIDPVAGAFQNYDNTGHYRGSRGGLHSLPTTYTGDRESEYQVGDLWFRDMLPPGFNTEIPERDNTIQQLAQQITQDRRFAEATIAFWWGAVMSGPMQEAPESLSDENYAALLQVYDTQQQFLKELADQFMLGIHGGAPYNLKDLMVEMIMSPWFRAQSSSQPLTAEQHEGMQNIGVDRLLTPEELAQKTKDLVGFSWGESSSAGSTDATYNHLKDKFNTYYGGIDSFGITERSHEITSLMSNVALGQALAVSCAAVVMDFAKNMGERLLFTEVEKHTLPIALTHSSLRIQNAEPASPYQVTLPITSTGTKHLRVSLDNPLPNGNVNARKVYIDRFQLEDENGVTVLSLEGEALLSSGGSALDYDGNTAGSADNSSWTFSRGYLEIPLTITSTGQYQLTIHAHAKEEQSSESPLLSIYVTEQSPHSPSLGSSAVKQQLQFIHKQLLGEDLAPDSAELEASYQTFIDIWNHRWQSQLPFSLADGDQQTCAAPEGTQFSDEQLVDPQHMQATWARMLIFFMTDYKYLHE